MKRLATMWIYGICKTNAFLFASEQVFQFMED